MKRQILFFAMFLLFMEVTNGQKLLDVDLWHDRFDKDVTLHVSLFSDTEDFLDEIVIAWGNGTIDTVNLGDWFLHIADVYKASVNIYYSYDTFGCYNMSFRIGDIGSGIVNLEDSFELDVDALICVDSMLYSSGPAFTSSPSSVWFNDGIATHSSAPHESDADSYVLKIEPFPGSTYGLPEATDSITINNSGELTWDKPIVSGFHAIRIIAEEWRAGNWLGSSSRYMLIEVPEIVGIDDELDIENLQVHPNPCTRYIQLKGNGETIQSGRISICSIGGICKDIEITGGYVDVSSFADGFYILNFLNNGLLTSIPLIIQKSK